VQFIAYHDQFPMPLSSANPSKEKFMIVSVYIKSEKYWLRHEHQDADDMASKPQDRKYRV